MSVQFFYPSEDFLLIPSNLKGLSVLDLGFSFEEDYAVIAEVPSGSDAKSRFCPFSKVRNSKDICEAFRV